MSFLRLPAAGAMVVAGWSGAALAFEAGIADADLQAGTARVELIDSSRLGCGQGTAPWAPAAASAQCAFDTATRGASMVARHDLGSGSIETYATAARSTSGAFTPERLLQSPRHRADEATDFFLVGAKASGLDGRLKLTAEFARTNRVVDALLARDWALADTTSSSGSSALLRVNATLADRPGLKWSLSGEYRSVSDDFSVGRSAMLLRHFAMPGTRLALSTKARIGRVGLNAGIDQLNTAFGSSLSGKAGVSFDGAALRFVSRVSAANGLPGSSLLDSQTRTQGAYLDLDTATLATWLAPEMDRLPFFIPANVSLSYRSGETESRYQATTERYGRSSQGIDASWETSVGETTLSYWRDTRTAFTAGTRSGSTETYQVYHGVRRGHWRFGLDASLTRSRYDGSGSFRDRSLSFGQSIAYSTPNGPEFRLQFGQDRNAMRMLDDSYVSADRYSRITASLDLSRYLQTRFERSDLKLTVDYRKTVDRTDGEFMLGEETIDHWIDADRREGLLISFGMKL